MLKLKHILQYYAIFILFSDMYYLSRGLKHTICDGHFEPLRICFRRNIVESRLYRAESLESKVRQFCMIGVDILLKTMWYNKLYKKSWLYSLFTKSDNV